MKLMLHANELDHTAEKTNNFIHLEEMKNLIKSMPSKRNKKYDGRFKNRGMSKLLTDVYSMNELKRKVVLQNVKRTGDLERVENIVAVIAEESGITIDQMKNTKRTRSEADARHIASFIIRMTTVLHLSDIGKYLTHGLAKDHSTVIHGCQKVVDKLDVEQDESFVVLFNTIRNKLKLWHGIEFNLEDWTKFPDWYRKMREK